MGRAREGVVASETAVRAAGGGDGRRARACESSVLAVPLAQARAGGAAAGRAVGGTVSDVTGRDVAVVTSDAAI